VGETFTDMNLPKYYKLVSLQTLIFVEKKKNVFRILFFKVYVLD